MICENCGAEFACSRSDVTACWCAKESYRLPLQMPSAIGIFKDCLCPTCLQQVEKLLRTRKTTAAT